MFDTISWSGYWVTIALLTTAYYLIVYLVYFRADFSIRWGKGARQHKKHSFAPVTGTESYSGDPQATLQPSLFSEESEDFLAPPRDTLEHAVYTCTDEISAYLQEAKRQKCHKEELIFAFQTILKKYPAIRSSPYKESLTHVMVSQCDYLCSVHLCAEDMVRVWKGA